MRTAVLTIALGACASWGIAGAQTVSPSPAASSATSADDAGVERIVDVFTKPHIAPDNFSADFVQKMPPARLEGIVKQLKVVLGDLRDVKKSTGKNEPPFDDKWLHYVATCTKGTDDVYIRFNDAGKVDGLIFREMHPL